MALPPLKHRSADVLDEELKRLRRTVEDLGRLARDHGLGPALAPQIEKIYEACDQIGAEIDRRASQSVDGTLDHPEGGGSGGIPSPF